MLHSFETDIAVKILSPVAIIILKSALSKLMMVFFVSYFSLFVTIKNPKNIILLSTFSL